MKRLRRLYEGGIMKNTEDKKCCKCLKTIEAGEDFSYLNNKYKIAGEEVCEECIDKEVYKLEKSIQNPV